jgi:hypothetical protein
VIIQTNEAKNSPKRQKELKTQMNGKYNDVGELMKINKKSHCRAFV